MPCGWSPAIFAVCEKQAEKAQYASQHNLPVIQIVPSYICLTHHVWDFLVEYSHTTWLPHFLGLAAVGRQTDAVSAASIQQFNSKGFATNSWVVNDPVRLTLVMRALVLSGFCHCVPCTCPCNAIWELFMRLPVLAR